MLVKLERAPHALMGKRQAPLQFAGSNLGNVRNPLAVKFVQLRLVLERIHLADAAAHEEHDAIFGLARKWRHLDRERIDAGRSAPRFARQKARQRKAAEPVEHPAEKSPPTGTGPLRPKCVLKWIIRHTQIRWR